MFVPRVSNPRAARNGVRAFLVLVSSAFSAAIAQSPSAGEEQPIDPAFAAALDAYHDSRYVEARSALEPLAHAGRSEAQYLLGVIYERGFAVDPDPLRAQSWYLCSRQLHNREARKAAARLARLLGPEQSRRANELAADDRLALDKDHGCMSFFGEPFLSHYVSLVQAQAPLEDMVEEILGFTGSREEFRHPVRERAQRCSGYPGERALPALQSPLHRPITTWLDPGLLQVTLCPNHPIGGSP